MRLIDSHCHLADARFGDSLADVMARSRSAGVDTWIVPSARRGEWSRLADMSVRGLYPAFGVHPWYCDRHHDGDRKRLEGLLSRAVAVGECGLDFGRGRPDWSIQRQWLCVQLDMAQACDLPVILHACKAEDALTGVLKARPGLRGVVHGFAGSRQQAERLIGLGFYLGVGTRILHRRAQRLREMFAALPLERLLLESDAPDQSPPGWQGDNEPGCLPSVAGELGVVRDMSPQEVANRCNINARELFGL